jgi:hypothetical protein
MRRLMVQRQIAGAPLPSLWHHLHPMLSPEDICRRALSRYPDFLRSIVNGSPFFPLPIRFGKPSATEDFEKLRSEITALTKANLGCHIEWTEVNSRRWGKQQLPERVEFADEATYLRALSKTKEVARFRENLALTREECPALIPFIEARPLDAVELAGSCKVCSEFVAIFTRARTSMHARYRLLWTPNLSSDTRLFFLGCCLSSYHLKPSLRLTDSRSASAYAAMSR